MACVGKGPFENEYLADQMSSVAACYLFLHRHKRMPRFENRLGFVITALPTRKHAEALFAHDQVDSQPRRPSAAKLGARLLREKNSQHASAILPSVSLQVAKTM